MMGTSTEITDTPTQVDSLPANTQRRSEDRTDYHTVVSVVIPGQTLANGQPRIIKGRSEDVSVTGARVISVEPFSAPRVYLRFLLPDFGDRFVEGEIVTESARKHITLNGGVKKLYSYGVRFVGIVSNEDIARIMAPATSDPNAASQS